ncbi:MAG: UDP-N-acetylmuramoyl-L-alanine--D-glutamate ligase [Tetrasphaera sp.]
MRRNLADLTHRDADWAGLRVLVAGVGVSGFAAADTLADRGARLLVVDGQTLQPGSAAEQRATLLSLLDVEVRTGPDAAAALPAGREFDLVVTSPGWRPDQPMLAAAARDGIPVWGEVELAWRMRPAEGAAPWLTITGTNGKTTTVQMLASILRAAGLRATSAGNVGTPILDVVVDPEPYDVVAVELSSFQLHWTHSISPLASACLNIAPDHLDWHGSAEAYWQAKARVYERTQRACVYNVADDETRRMVEQAEVVEGARAIGFTTGVPGVSMLGVVDDVLADRAFVAERQTMAAELGTLADLARGGLPPAPHVVANALAAAALARTYGVPPVAVRDGLRAFVPEPHRMAAVAEVGEVRYVDDSKATNPHAAQASLQAFDPVVWIAGGLLKGADIDPLVADIGGRLRGVVLLGADRRLIAQSLARHAPEVPVVEVSDTDTGAMDRVVSAAASLARPGDVVLLAPAGASMDMFANYGARGDAFARAVHALRDSAE